MFDFQKFPMIDHMDSAKIDKAIKDVVKHYNSAKGREHLHLVLDACARHGVAHNSGEHLTRLFNSLPANANKDGIKTWVHEFTTFKWLKNKDGVHMFLSRDNENAKVPAQYNLAGSATPFYDMEKVKAKQDKPYSFLLSLETLLKNAAAKQKNGKMNDPVEKVLFTMLSDSLPAAIATAKQKATKAQDNVHQLEAA